MRINEITHIKPYVPQDCHIVNHQEEKASIAFTRKLVLEENTTV